MVVTVHDHKALESCGLAIIWMQLVIFSYLCICIRRKGSRTVGMSGNGNEARALSVTLTCLCYIPQSVWKLAHFGEPQ